MKTVHHHPQARLEASHEPKLPPDSNQKNLSEDPKAAWRAYEFKKGVTVTSWQLLSPLCHKLEETSNNPWVQAVLYTPSQNS